MYLIDRTGSIAAQWPPNIRDEDVCTPFPKPLHEYELGLVSSRDDYSLASLYDDGPPQVLPYNTESSGTILYMKALALLAQASKLLYLPAEKKRSSSLSSSDGSSISPPDIDEYLRQQSYYASRPPTAEGPAENRHNTRTPSIRTPRAFERCRFALTRLESELPPDLRTAWGTWDGMAPQWVFQNPQKITMTLVSRVCTLTDGSTSCLDVRGCSCSIHVLIPLRIHRPWLVHKGWHIRYEHCSQTGFS